MNAPLDLRMDKATFLRWVQHQQGRWELIGGRPVMQQSPKRVHGSIARNFWFESCLAFTYANSAVVPAGTYTQQVVYSLTAP